MPLLSVSNLRYTIGTRVLLDGAAFSIENGERVGLVGRNGTGKTTLMKIIMGRVKPDSGTVTFQKGARLGYLSQDPDLNPDRTLLEEAIAGFAELATLHAELEEVFEAMALPENGGPEQMERLLRRQADLQQRIEAWGSGGYAVEHQAEAILHGLGFTDAQFGVRVGDLSGGQKGRLSLAKLLLESPDLLLLDEPTNHLDIAGREWLEEFLINDYSGAVMMISHDRYMLDRVVDRIEEVEQGRLIEYPGNYTAFIEIRRQRLLTQQRAYENQQAKWAKEEEFIRRFRAGQRAKEAQGRLSKLEREKELFAIERPVEMASLRMELAEAPRSSEQVVLVRGAGKWYPPPDEQGDPEAEPERKHVRREERPGDKVLFRNLDLAISRGERWGVIGPNGAGKTTLVRAILGEIPLSAGTTKLGFNVATGYFSQLPPGADDELKVYQYLQAIIRRENPGKPLSEQAARNLAGAFLFSGEAQEKPLGVLSGGERSRARLAGLLASAKNLLVLDEPTNHLDIPAAERLEQALLPAEKGGAYDGTLILISHDRALIDSTCDHLLILDGRGGVTVFHGNYSDWQRKQREQAAKGAEAGGRAGQGGRAAKPAPKRSEPVAAAAPAPAKSASAAGANGVGAGSGGRGGGGGSGSAGKSQKKGGKHSWMPVERLEAEIQKQGARLKELDDQLALEEVYRDPRRFNDLLKERETVAAEVEALEEEWLRRAE